MVMVALAYGALVYLIFFKLEWLPWNKPSQLISLALGILILTGFMVGLENLTPTTRQAVITGRIVDIAPQVAGRVSRVVVEQNVDVEKGAVLFEIDPTSIAARLRELEANLALARLRLGQFTELAAVEAASQFQVEQTEAEIEQLEARLERTQFDLDNTKVRAPSKGRVPRLRLQPGVQVSPLRAVMTFMDTDELVIGGLVDQKALQTVKVGDVAKVSFPALPGRLFDTEVRDISSAIAEGQFFASGVLDSVLQQRMTRVYPIFVSLPEDFPPELRKAGLAANVTIMTEGAGPIAILALVLQWLQTSLDAVL